MAAKSWQHSPGVFSYKKNADDADILLAIKMLEKVTRKTEIKI